MTPWRRRLCDYSQLLHQADQTYFEPDLFRLNTQNAIQTARTVTFLMQKNKSKIHNFEVWYKENVLDVFAADPVMNWLKESRNFIEKEGDLSVFSECSVELLYSYTDRGPRLVTKREELLGAGIKKILRFSQKHFPTGVLNESALIVDRRWVANTLPGMELTDALQHGLDVLSRVVDALDRHVGETPLRQQASTRIPVGSLARRAYVKTKTGRTVYLSHQDAKTELNSHTVDAIKARYGADTFAELPSTERALAEEVGRIARVANRLFNADRSHINLCFVLNADLLPMQIIQVDFEDHADKFIFWSHLAHWVSLHKDAAAIMFVGEMWLRELDGFPYKSVSQLRITGEGLWTVGLSKTGEYVSKQFAVVENDGKKQVGDELEITGDRVPNFLVPLIRVWGLEPKFATRFSSGAMASFDIQRER